MPEAAAKEGPRTERRQWFALYGVWAALVALFAGAVLAAGSAKAAAFFALILLVLPPLVVGALLLEQCRIARVAERLGFRVRRVSWNEGTRPRPAFDDETPERDWWLDVVEGIRDGTEAAAYGKHIRAGTGRGRSRKYLGATWVLPGASLPRLQVLGAAVVRGVVTAVDPADSRARSAPLAPPSPVPGFDRAFAAEGEPGAEALLTEAVQRALLGLPRRCRLAVEGDRLRWEAEVDPLLGRGLASSAERLLARTAPLRDALIEARELARALRRDGP